MADGRLIARGDLAAALALLTRLPVPVPQAALARGARAAWAYPIAGALVGGLAGLGGAGALMAGLSPATAGGIVLALQILLTGALHEDGLADMADGVGGGGSPERRLAIMRDSRIGSFGALALILSVGLRGSLLAALAPGALVAAAVAAGALSRAGMAGVMAALPPARPDGLSAAMGRPGVASAALAGGMGMLAAATATGVALAVVAAAAALAAAAGVGLLARAKLGGQTGDALGAAQQAAEIAALMAIAATL